MRWFIILSVALALVADRASAEENLRPVRKIGKPIDTLPEEVKAPDKELTFFADYDNKTDTCVPIYVVNRTDKPVQFKHQDGSIYMKLEYEASRGKWVRAQSHLFSWCGNSYTDPPVLEPGHYTMQRGYVPAEGARYPVRYSLYGQSFKASTNVGAALVDLKDVDWAAHDGMSLSTGDFDFVAKTALGEFASHYPEGMERELRYQAISRLGRKEFDPARSIEVLRKVVEGAGAGSDASLNDTLARFAREKLNDLGAPYDGGLKFHRE